MQRFVLLFLIVWSTTAHGLWDQLSVSQQQKTLAQTATRWESRKQVRLHGKPYRSDCSGFVQAVLDRAQLQWQSFARVYDVQSNGVHILHQFVQRVGATHQNPEPAVGDLVFFHNTYDRNRDAATNDLWTHIGIVTGMDRDQTVTFHHYLNGRVRKSVMNLRHPYQHQRNGKIINTYLRRRAPSASSQQPLLAALLFADFGRLTRP